MSILIVGADHLDLKGRKNINRRNLRIPKGTDLILVMTDYIDHNIARTIREEAKNQAIPAVFSKRSWSNLFQKLQRVEGLA